MIRCFIAIDIDDEDIIGKIRDVQSHLNVEGVKLVEPENIHLTLKFLGNVPEERIKYIAEELDTISFKKFSFRIRGVGAFPNVNRPRVVWLGIREGAEKLVELQEIVENCMKRIGFRPEPKKFHPHITLLRVKRFNPVLQSRIRDVCKVEIGSFNVSCIRLKKSVLTPKGPIYSTLYEKPLEE